MANTITSPNMNLPVPVVGTDPGPDWANNINGSLALIDSHNHSSGSGVQINPSGLNINADLPLNGNNVTTARSLRFTSQGTPISGATDLGCLSVSGADLYYRDESGNNIRITQSGGVAGTNGSIGGLVSPASVNYSSGPGTYVFQSAASTPGNLDAASVVIRDQTASSNGVTLNAPAALASNYSLTFPPALPASQSFATISNAGNIASSISTTGGITSSMIASQAITQAQLAPKPTNNPGLAGQVGVSSPFSFSTSSATLVSFTGASITLTTTGRPVMIFLQTTPNLSGTTTGFIEISGSNSALIANIYVVNSTNSTVPQQLQLGILTSPSNAVLLPPSSVYSMDYGVAGSAGTYTWILQGSVASASNTLNLSNCVMIAYEI